MNVIPLMLDPLGRHWDQPSRDDITLDDESALMEERIFKQLKDYSHSIPTGVYNGKMWKCFGGSDWFLCWYGNSEKPNCCRTYYRTIIYE